MSNDAPLAIDTAIVLCPAGTAVHRRLLGLTIGERLLLALARGGVEKVWFAGSGPRPECERAALMCGEASEFVADVGAAGAHASSLWVLAADTVIAPGALRRQPADALQAAEQAASGPLLAIPRSTVAAVASAADSWLTRLADLDAGEGPDFVIRVTDTRSTRVGRRALLQSLRKPIDGLVSRHLNRRVSTSITRVLVTTGVGPNPLTVLFALIGVSAGVFAVFADTWWCLVAAGVLFQMQSILDGCDGEIARLTYRFSRVGQWLDSIGDDLTNYAFCLGLAIGQARVLDWPPMYWLGALTLLVQVAASTVLYRRMIAMGTGDLLAIPDTVTGGDSGPARVLAALRVLAKRDTFVFIVAVLTAAQQPLLGFAVLAGGSYPMFLGVIVNERRLRALERKAAA